MALDKLVDSTQLDADLTSVANALRTKGGTSASLAFPADFVTAIGNIQTGGGGRPEANENDVVYVLFIFRVREVVAEHLLPVQAEHPLTEHPAFARPLAEHPFVA